MAVDFESDIKPFFQVLVKQISKKVTAHQFYKEFKRLLNERSNSASKHSYKIIKPTSISENDEDHFFAAHIKHKQVPTWYKAGDKVDLNDTSGASLYDIENDLLVFYRKDDYIFVHTNCSQIFSLIIETQDFLSEDGSKFRKLTGQQLNQVLAQFEIEYRSLGMQNHFGAGGSAPDGKAYYGRDASNCLTPSFDAGYGFSFCIGRMLMGDGNSRPFGCSKSKSKIWTTWIEDLNKFCDQCDLVVQWLTSSPKENKQLEVLIQSVSKSIIPKLKPVEFFLDYYILEKGLVFLGDDTGLSLDWHCKYDVVSGQIDFNIQLEDSLLESSITFRYDTKEEAYMFVYMPGQPAISVAVAEGEDRITTRSTHDLVEFLNKQDAFTILYDEPYAYRGNECWMDNRLKRLFSKGTAALSWKGVDIRKENLKATPKLNILERIDEHFIGDKALLFGCIDNGANEIADYLAIYENRIILIHAKYASSNTPGLTIRDIQVVASQVVKNIRFFSRNAYSDAIITRLFKNATNAHGFADEKTFGQKLFSILQNKDTEFECWIAQPGISLKRLAADPVNKMHTILNFVESILRVNNISFKLYCSP